MSMQLEAGLAFVRTTAPIALVFIVLAVIMKRRGVFDAARRCRAEFTTNCWLVLINYAVLGPLAGIAAGSVAVMVGTHPAMEAIWAGVWAPLIVVVAVMLIDFVAYWRHRWEHSRALWQIHATHHSDTAMNWLSVTRKHPFSRFLSVMADNVLVIALGMPWWAIGLANLLRTWWGYFTHADVPWTLGLMGKVMISPAAHRLHHIRDEKLMGTNFANTITLWDKLFGTYCDPLPYLNCETGIEGGSRNVVGELARPFEAMARRIGAGPARRPAAER